MREGIICSGFTQCHFVRLIRVLSSRRRCNTCNGVFFCNLCYSRFCQGGSVVFLQRNRCVKFTIILPLPLYKHSLIENRESLKEDIFEDTETLTGETMNKKAEHRKMCARLYDTTLAYLIAASHVSYSIAILYLYIYIFFCLNKFFIQTLTEGLYFLHKSCSYFKKKF